MQTKIDVHPLTHTQEAKDLNPQETLNPVQVVHR